MPVAPGTSIVLAIEVSLEIDISLRSARFRKPPSSHTSSVSLSVISGGSTVATLVAPFSPLASVFFALDARERGCFCGINYLY